MIQRVIAAALIVLLACCPTFAATGDILFQCNFSGAGTAKQIVEGCGAPSNYTARDFSTVSIAGSGGHDNGPFINFNYPNDGNADFTDYYSSSTLNKQEITITWWERYDVAVGDATANWNTKSIRPMLDGSNYFGALVTRLDSGWIYTSSWGDTPAVTVTGTSLISEVRTPPTYANTYCSLADTLTWSCPIAAGSGGRFAFKLSPVLGTTWHHFRLYMKAPSTTISVDGRETLWIDDDLVYSTGDFAGDGAWATTVDHVVFSPSIGFVSSSGAIEFNLQQDDVVIYEGYVPPAGADTTAPVTTISTSDPSAITTGNLTVEGTASDAVGVSGCKWRLSSAPDASNGTACTGTTSFSCATNGYASGANTMYVGCYDAAGNYGSDSITVNYTPPTSTVSGVAFDGFAW